MASIAQAVTSSVYGAANQTGAEPAAPATLPVPEGTVSRPQDTVKLTETGGRNVAIAALGGKAPSAAPAAFRVAYFPASSAPRAKSTSTPPTAAQAAAAVAPTQTNSPAAQVANAAAEAAAANSSSSTSAASGVSSAATSPTSALSAASQAKLQQLDQELQQMGINPAQVSFAARIALLPLVNDPAAIQQYVSGLPVQSAVLEPATSLSSATAVLSSQTGSASASGANEASANRGDAGIGTGRGVEPASRSNGASAFSPATTPSVTAASGSSADTGQKVNISV